MRKISVALSILTLSSALFLPSSGFAEPKISMLFGSPVCPELNAHEGNACRFKRGDHTFQVWPNRISIQAIPGENAWLITDNGHKDLMFDHDIVKASDDHISFQCIVKGKGGYAGPINVRYKRGGKWKTYGKAVEVASSIGGGAIAGYFTGGLTTQQGAAAGGAIAHTLGKEISSSFGDTSWEIHAKRIADEICSTLAGNTVAPFREVGGPVTMEKKIYKER